MVGSAGRWLYPHDFTHKRDVKALAPPTLSFLYMLVNSISLCSNLQMMSCALKLLHKDGNDK